MTVSEPPDGEHDPYVFTTVRFDAMLVKSAENTAASCGQPCPFYMLEHHWSRLQVAKWDNSLKRGGPAELLHTLSDDVREWYAHNPGEKPESLRLRHRTHLDGRSATDISRVDRIPFTSLFPPTLDISQGQLEDVKWTVVLDKQTSNVSAATMYKTWDRREYDRARATASIKAYVEPKEVLLYNDQNEIMDGSISTPHFFRDGRWITPGASSGGQQGTTRRWALVKGLCVEDTIKKDDLRDGEVIWLSNGSRGFFLARYLKT